MIDVPADKNYPADALQCDDCGGTGGLDGPCRVCSGKGWVLAGHPRARRCANPNCPKFLEPTRVPVYCSNQCALDDA